MKLDSVKVGYFNVTLFNLREFIVENIFCCKDKGIRISDFVANTQFLWIFLIVVSQQYHDLATSTS